MPRDAAARVCKDEFPDFDRCPNSEVHTWTEDGDATTEVTGEVAGEVRLLQVLSGEMTRQGLREALGLRNDKHFRKANLLPALQAGLIEMTIPDKPRSRNQRYRLTRWDANC